MEFNLTMDSPRPAKRARTDGNIPPTSEEALHSTVYGRTRIEVIAADATTFPISSIVNAANTNLRRGSGIQSAIHDAAGPGLLAELERRYPNGGTVGNAYPTTAHGIKTTQYIIHAIGPAYNSLEYRDNEELAHRHLRDAYTNSMQAAMDRGATSIAFPTISTGIFMFPAEIASRIMMAAVRSFLDQQEDCQFERIVFLVWAPDGESQDLENYDANFKAFWIKEESSHSGNGGDVEMEDTGVENGEDPSGTQNDNVQNDKGNGQHDNGENETGQDDNGEGVDDPSRSGANGEGQEGNEPQRSDQSYTDQNDNEPHENEKEEGNGESEEEDSPVVKEEPTSSPVPKAEPTDSPTGVTPIIPSTEAQVNEVAPPTAEENLDQGGIQGAAPLPPPAEEAAPFIPLKRDDSEVREDPPPPPFNPNDYPKWTGVGPENLVDLASQSALLDDNRDESQSSGVSKREEQEPAAETPIAEEPEVEELASPPPLAVPIVPVPAPAPAPAARSAPSTCGADGGQTKAGTACKRKTRGGRCHQHPRP